MPDTSIVAQKREALLKQYKIKKQQNIINGLTDEQVLEFYDLMQSCWKFDQIYECITGKHLDCSNYYDDVIDSYGELFK